MFHYEWLNLHQGVPKIGMVVPSPLSRDLWISRQTPHAGLAADARPSVFRCANHIGLWVLHPEMRELFLGPKRDVSRALGTSGHTRWTFALETIGYADNQPVSITGHDGVEKSFIFFYKSWLLRIGYFYYSISTTASSSIRRNKCHGKLVSKRRAQTDASM